MKKILNNVAFISAFAVLAASCVKGGTEDNFKLNYQEKTVMINYAVENPLAVLAVTPPATGNLQLDMGNVSVSLPGENKNNITVKLVQNNTLIANYNTTNFTNYEPIPLNAISLPSEVVIPAGSKQAPIIASINHNILNLSKSYAIGLSIASVTGASGIQINNLYKDCLFGVIIKNKYDGKYQFRGRTAVTPDRPATFSSAPYTYPFDILLATSGANTVNMINTAFGPTATFHPLMLTTAPSGFGQTAPQFTFNTTTDALIGVTNTFVGGTLGRQFILNPAVTDSRYQASNKTVYAAIMLTQPGFQNLPLFDTLRYIGPR